MSIKETEEVMTEEATTEDKVIEETVVEEDGTEKQEYLYTQKGDKTLVSDLMLAERELDELKEKYGLQEEEKGVKKAISSFFDKREAQAQKPIKKRTYVLLAVFLGWFGAHRFYTKQYTTAILYLLTCWCGYSIAMTIVDLVFVIPKKPDENGNIYL